MTRFRIAMLQLTSHGGDVERNLEKGLAACREAKALGADLAVFPEMWSIGYAESPDDEAGNAAWKARAVAADGDFVAAHRTLARELEMAICVTYLEQWPEQPRNAASLIDMRGNVVLQYAKIHTCDFGMERWCTPGTDLPVAELAFAGGTVKVGTLICYDREFPETARILMLEGAELLLNPNASEMVDVRIAQALVRSTENMVGFVVVNYAAPQHNGHSCAYDGMQCERDGTMRDAQLVVAGEQEQIVVADLDLDALRAYREYETWGDAFRKPALYGRLLETGVAPPFVRPEARR